MKTTTIIEFATSFHSSLTCMIILQIDAVHWHNTIIYTSTIKSPSADQRQNPKKTQLVDKI